MPNPLRVLPPLSLTLGMVLAALPHTSAQAQAPVTPVLLADLALGATGAGANSSNPSHFVELPGAGTLFKTYTGTTPAIWITDGTASGTTELAAFPNGYVSELFVVGDRALFFPTVVLGQRQLWTTDGTVNGTFSLGTLSGLYGVTGAAVAGDRVFFLGEHATTGIDLWVTDGTLAGTRVVRDLYTAPGTRPFAIGERVIFAADDGVSGSEPWISDGTPAGTHMILDVNPGPESSVPLMVRHGDAVYFGAHVGSAWSGVWRTDGTAAGTQLFWASPGLVVPAYAAGNHLFGWSLSNELIALDVTTGVPTSLGSVGGPTADFHAFGDGVVFRGGSLLWFTDGTPSGTRQLDTWSQTAVPGEGFHIAGSRVAYYSTSVGLFRTDGTASGTFALTTTPARYLGHGGGKLFYRGFDVATGYEPWMLDLGATSSNLGTGLGELARVPTLRMTDPVIGLTTTIELEHGVSGSMMMLGSSIGAPRPLHVMVDTWSYFGQSWVSLQFQVIAAPSLQLVLPLPNDPGLAGLDVVFQAALLGTTAARGFELTNAVHGILGF